MFRVRNFLVLVLVFALAACALNPAAQPTDPGSAEMTTVRLPMGYIPSVQYAPFYVAAAKNFYKEAGLEVEFDYSPETDGVALVGANELQFAVVSGEQVPLARAQGLPVVYVMAWWQDYPVAVLAMKDKGIRTPADLAGKKIGLPGLYGANYVGLRALLSVAGLEEKDVTLDSIGYNQVEALVAGREDAVVVYANNEPIQMTQKGYDVDVILVKDYMQLASNGLISNETTIANNPDLVRRMVQATQRGIAYTLANPDEAFAICAQFVEGLMQGDQVTQRAIFDTSLEFWKTKQLGVSDPVAWENMQEVLLTMGMLTQPLDMSKAFTNEFAEK
jgi:NitT/TauT family transport system substrate-binding protein